METIRRRFALDVGWSLFISAIITTIGFLVRIVLARWLGADDLGLYTTVITINGFATIVATLGIPTALTKYVAEYKDDRNLLLRNTSAALVSSVIFGLVVSAGIFTISGILARVFDMPELSSLLKILAAVFPFTCVLRTIIGIFLGLRQMRTYAYIEISHQLFMTLSIVALVGFGFGIEGAITGIVISSVGGLIIGLFFSRSFMRIIRRDLIQNVKKLVFFGIQITGVNALNLVMVQSDVLLIAFFMTDENVGYYSVAVSLSVLFAIIPQAFQRISYPASSEYWSLRNYPALRTMIDRSMKYSACLVLPLALGSGFFSERIVTIIYGHEFISATLPFLILLIARSLRGSTVIPVGSVMTGAGRPDINLKLDAFACVMNIILNILFIPRWGITGAAAATSASLLVHTALYLVAMRRIMKVSIDIRWYVKAMGITSIAIALFILGRISMSPDVAGGIVLFVFIILVFRFFLNKEDRATINSLLHPLLTKNRDNTKA